ncbi:MAG: TrbC/VirB2 family protein [Candidatus Peribacteraceae bacterium]|nr:TrbC/VirB2 family protein [Candidatus Peribacteraceae bacterium]MDD5742517.1 TrbC/VirB2 family protein [Candidatus Peribacteraceae bacterium]
MTHLRSLGLKLAAIVVCSAPYQALAQIENPPNVAGRGPSDLRDAIMKVIQKVLTFMTLIAVVMIIVAGIRYIISQGEESEKDKAKKMIIYVIIGLIIILISQAIVTFVIDTVA